MLIKITTMKQNLNTKTVKRGSKLATKYGQIQSLDVNNRDNIQSKDNYDEAINSE